MTDCVDDTSILGEIVWSCVCRNIVSEQHNPTETSRSKQEQLAPLNDLDTAYDLLVVTVTVAANTADDT
jgi:hypothetical protein